MIFAYGSGQCQIMSMGDGGCPCAPVEALQPLAGCFRCIQSTASIMTEILSDGLVGAPHRALHSWNVKANAFPMELVCHLVPRGQVFQLLGASAGFVATAIIGEAHELIGENALAILAELSRGAGLGSHGLQLLHATIELLALDVNDLRELLDERVGILGVANTHALLAGACSSMAQRSREGVLTHHTNGAEDQLEGDGAIVRGASHKVLVDFIAFHHFAHCAIELGGEGDALAFCQDAHGVHGGVLVQGFSHANELLVLDDGVAVALDGQHGAIVCTGDGLVARDLHHVAGEDGGSDGVPVGIGNAEGFTGRQGAVQDGAELVPCALVVEEHAGGELVAHGSEEGGAVPRYERKISWF